MSNETENSSAQQPVAYVITPKDPTGSPFLVFSPTVFTGDNFKDDYLIEPLYGKAPSNNQANRTNPRSG